MFHFLTPTLLAGFSLSLPAKSASQMDGDSFPSLNSAFLPFQVLAAPEIPGWNASFALKLSLPMAALGYPLFLPLLLGSLPSSLAFSSPSILNASSPKFPFSILFPLKIREFLLTYQCNNRVQSASVIQKINVRWRLCERHSWNRLFCGGWCECARHLAGDTGAVACSFSPGAFVGCSRGTHNAQ